jgi:hypothetical protein
LGKGKWGRRKEIGPKPYFYYEIIFLNMFQINTFELKQFPIHKNKTKAQHEYKNKLCSSMNATYMNLYFLGFISLKK